MYSIQRASLLVVVVSAALYTGQCQLFGTSPGALVGDLAPGIAGDIVSILLNQAFVWTGICTPSNDASQVKFWLFTRPNPSNYVVLNSANDVDISKPIIFVIHGWGGNGDIDYIHVIKEAYLQRYDCNVISVDYSTLAGGQYPSAYCNVPFVGTVLGQFICQLKSRGVNLKNIHIVGHSLGAQVAGCAGRQVQVQCSSSVGRITGLDPAGPLFDTASNDIRLDKGDATFVDVIHTNMGQYGCILNCGHVDFFPNCGFYQPPCIQNLVNILSQPLSVVTCSHQRSCYLFAESINSNRFQAVSCNKCGYLCGVFALFDYTYMGESCRSKPKYSEYFVDTNAASPYAQGPTGPLN